MNFELDLNHYDLVLNVGEEYWNFGYRDSTIYGIPIALACFNRQIKQQNLFKDFSELFIGKRGKLEHSVREFVSSSLDFFRAIPFGCCGKLNLEMNVAGIGNFSSGGGQRYYLGSLEDDGINLDVNGEERILTLSVEDSRGLFSDYVNFFMRDMPDFCKNSLRSISDYFLEVE